MKVTIPVRQTVEVSAGTANAIAIGNDGTGSLRLNTTDPSPSADGGLITLEPGDTVSFAAGSAWAAAVWQGWSPNGTVAIVTEV